MYQALIQVIQNNEDISRWNAIEQLMEDGYTLKNINKDAGFGKNYLNKWRYRNKKKYKSKKSDDNPSLTHRKPTTNDGKSSIPIDKKRAELAEIRRTTYGRIDPTFYQESISSMDDLVKWIKTYTRYMQDGPDGDWDNQNTREMAYNLFFDVFVNGFSKMNGRPRDSGKSKISVAIYACIAANYWLPQSIIVNGFKAQRRIYNGLYYIFTQPKFRKKYGDMFNSMSKNSGHFEYKYIITEHMYNSTGYVTDDPAIQISQYNGIVGSHPFIAYLEDMMQSEYKSEESNDYVLYEVFDGIIRKLTDRIGGTFTRKGPNDLYSNLPDRGIALATEKCIRLLKGRYPTVDDLIINDDGVPEDVIIPDDSEYEIIDRPGWTVKSVLLDRTRALLDKRSFQKWMREMQNEIIAIEGQYFDRALWLEIDPIPMKMIKKGCYIIYDPAYGKSTSADFACLYVAVVHNGRIHNPFTELHRGLSLDQQVWLLEYYHEWLKPKFVYVETKFAQVWLQQQLNVSLPLEPWQKKGEKSLQKTERIDGLSLPYARGKLSKSSDMASGVSIPGHRCTKRMCGESPNEEAFDQYLKYDQTPSDTTRKDDYLDCEATAFDKLKHHLGSKGWYTRSWTKKGR